MSPADGGEDDLPPGMVRREGNIVYALIESVDGEAEVLALFTTNDAALMAKTVMETQPNRFGVASFAELRIEKRKLFDMANGFIDMLDDISR